MPPKRRRKKKAPAAAAPAATAAPATLPRFPDPASLDRDDRVEVSIEMKTLGNKFFAAKDFGTWSTKRCRWHRQFTQTLLLFYRVVSGFFLLFFPRTLLCGAMKKYESPPLFIFCCRCRCWLCDVGEPVVVFVKHPEQLFLLLLLLYS